MKQNKKEIINQIKNKGYKLIYTGGGISLLHKSFNDDLHVELSEDGYILYHGEYDGNDFTNYNISQLSTYLTDEQHNELSNISELFESVGGQEGIYALNMYD